jgi:hypothetical protein
MFRETREKSMYMVSMTSFSCNEFDVQKNQSSSHELRGELIMCMHDTCDTYHENHGFERISRHRSVHIPGTAERNVSGRRGCRALRSPAEVSRSRYVSYYLRWFGCFDFGIFFMSPRRASRLGRCDLSRRLLEALRFSCIGWEPCANDSKGMKMVWK